MWILFLGDGTM